jgi:predicted membrane protein
MPSFLPILGITCAALVLSSCVINTNSNERTGPTEDMKKTIEMDKTTSTRVDIKMGAGTVNLRGGSSNLMDADFKYNVPGWKPVVKYEVTGEQGNLTIEQPSGEHSGLGNHEYTWDVQLNDDKPLNLKLEFGAGECNLNAGSLTLNGMDIKMGVGKMQLDLRGTPKKDYQVEIKGGVGEATIYVPAKVGVVAYAKGGLGEIDAKGLQKRGDRYVNDAYENNAKVSIRLDIKGGIGAIHFIGQ